MDLTNENNTNNNVIPILAARNIGDTKSFLQTIGVILYPCIKNNNSRHFQLIYSRLKSLWYARGNESCLAHNSVWLQIHMIQLWQRTHMDISTRAIAIKNVAGSAHVTMSFSLFVRVNSIVWRASDGSSWLIHIYQHVVVQMKLYSIQ